MPTSIEEITKGVVELPRHQRMAIIRLLLDLDRPGTGEEIEQAWDEEIRTSRSGRRCPSVSHRDEHQVPA